MSYRCAFLGCGPRAKGHARAYELIDKDDGELVALCDVNEERLNAFGDEFGIAARYTDLSEMLTQERPDVVHLVTPPTLRVELMTQLAEAGVPGVIVEKPICLGADDYHALRRLEAETTTRFVVNHQLRHHPLIREFLAEVRAGAIGQVRFIDATSVLPMAGQGVHVLDLMFAFTGYAAPTSVFGASSGYDDINGHHPSPKSAESLITFENGCRAAMMSGRGAPKFLDGPDWMHKRIAVYGTHGFLHWRMNGYERSRPGGEIETREVDYRTEDDKGQANLTTALFRWLTDDAATHPNNLKTSLDEWLVILAGYTSTLEAGAVELPFDPPDDLLDRFKRFVGAS